MKNEHKKQCLSIPTTSTTINQQALIPRTYYDVHSSNKANLISISDDVFDVYSRMKGDMKQIIRYADEILHHVRSTVEMRPDGSILITPHPRQIPSELLPLILDHLPVKQLKKTLHACTLVSKQFYDIANPLLWQELYFYDSFDFLLVPLPDREFYGNTNTKRFLDSIADASPQRLSTLGGYLRRLHMDSVLWTDAQLLRLLPHIPHLEHLTIYPYANITDTSFQCLPYHCQQLNSLQLSTTFTQTSFAAIGRHCHQLDKFHWIINRGQSLEWLDMLDTHSMDSFQLYTEHVTWNGSGLLIPGTWHNLTSLEILSNGHHPHYKPLIQLATGTLFLENDNNNNNNLTTPWWPQLTKLILSPCVDIDDTTLIEFIRSHPHLQVVELYEIRKLTDTSLDAMVMWLPNLTEMYWSGDNSHISPHGARRFIKNSSSHLVSLGLEFCSRIQPKHFPETTFRKNDVMELDQESIAKIKAAAGTNGMATNSRG